MTPEDFLKMIGKLTRPQRQAVIVLAVPRFHYYKWNQFMPTKSTARALVQKGLIEQTEEALKLTALGWETYTFLMEEVLEGTPLFQDYYVPKY